MILETIYMAWVAFCGFIVLFYGVSKFLEKPRNTEKIDLEKFRSSLNSRNKKLVIK